MKNNKCKFFACENVFLDTTTKHNSNVGVVLTREAKCILGESTQSPTQSPTTSPTLKPSKSPTTASPTNLPTPSPITLDCPSYITQKACNKRSQQCVWKRNKCRYIPTPTPEPTIPPFELPPTSSDMFDGWHHPTVFCGSIHTRAGCLQYGPSCVWKHKRCKRVNVEYGVNCENLKNKERCHNKQICVNDSCFKARHICYWDKEYEVCDFIPYDDPYYYEDYDADEDSYDEDYVPTDPPSEWVDDYYGYYDFSVPPTTFPPTQTDPPTQTNAPTTPPCGSYKTKETCPCTWKWNKKKGKNICKM
ncbi:MAG: PT domain-containing protein [Promethearchaeota archaeon]